MIRHISPAESALQKELALAIEAMFNQAKTIQGLESERDAQRRVLEQALDVLEKGGIFGRQAVIAVIQEQLK